MTKPRRAWTLRTLIPAFQVLAVLFLQYAKHWGNQKIYQTYVLPCESIIRALNFPLVLAWAPVLFIFDHLSHYLPSANGIWFALGVVVLGATLVSSVAFFWYIVVREIESNKNGEIPFRFAGWPSRFLATAILFSAGIGTLWYAYINQQLQWLVHLGGTVMGVALVIIPEFILLMLGIILIRFSIKCFLQRK